MKLAARLSTVVIGLLAAWLAVVQPANAVELGGTPAVIAYTYDSHTRASIPTYTTIERGPPVATEPDTTYNPVGHRSDGASARPDTLVAYGTTTYDVPASPAHIDNNTGTTRRPVEAINEEISSLRSGPVAANSADDLARLTASQQKSLCSLQRQVEEHRSKLDAYRRDPDAFDNLGYLERAPSPEIRQRIIDGRIRHLENEINTFQDQVDKLLGGG